MMKRIKRRLPHQKEKYYFIEKATCLKEAEGLEGLGGKKKVASKK